MDVIFYSNFYKKKNSTKRPGTGETVACRLKADCSVLSPRLEIEFQSSASNPVGWNYAYIDELGRYYYVADWKWEEHRKWCAYLEVDALATHKEDIGNSTQFVLRSSETSNGNVIDDAYFQECRTQNEKHAFQTLWSGLTTGSYIVSGRQTGGNANDMVGSVSYVGFTKEWMKDMIDTVSNQFTNFLNKPISSLTTNPLDFIDGCIFIPLTIEDLGGTVKSNYTLQGFESHQNYYSFNGQYRKEKTKVFEITDMPLHPDAEKYGVYLNGSKGTDIILFCPPFGVIPLNADLIKDCTSIYGNLAVDITNGNCKLDIYGTYGYGAKIDILLESIKSNCGCTFSMTSARIDMGGVLSGALGMVSGFAGTALSDKDLSQVHGIIGMADSARQTLESLAPHYSTVGSSAGGLSDIYGVPFIQYTYRRMSGIDVDNVGLPICKSLNIGAVGGYLKCATANVSTNATPQEVETIRSYMQGGFYYE